MTVTRTRPDKRSTKIVMQQDLETPTDLILDARTALAAERTLLAWVRTGLALMGFGFVVARFGLFLRELTAAEHLPPRMNTGISMWFGSSLLVLGVFVLVLSGIHHIALIRKLSSGAPYHVRTFSFGVILTFLLAAFGVAITGYLIYSTN